MKLKKNDADELKNLTIDEMKKINGGQTITYIMPDGKKIIITV
jgi:bacteriocin-like protein